MKTLYFALAAVFMIIAFSRCGKIEEARPAGVQTRPVKSGPAVPQPAPAAGQSFEPAPWTPAPAPAGAVDRPRETNLPPPPIPPSEGLQTPGQNRRNQNT